MKNLIVKIFILFISILFVSSCGETDNKDKSVSNDNDTKVQLGENKKAGLRFFPGEDFSIRIPAAWNDITLNKDIIPNPNNGKLELAVTSSETKDGFANNLIILSQKLDKKTSSVDYSIINHVGAENEYLNYFKKSEKEFTFDDGEKSIIYNFHAKYSTETPLLNFIQTAYVCNDKGFLLTIALPITIKDIEKYEKMLATFKCKNK